MIGLVRQIGILRSVACLVFVAAALLLARFSWQLPILETAERGFYDVRATLAAPTAAEQDSRIVIFTYDESTLALVQRRSPLDRAILGEALRQLDGMEPRAIGVDILIDQPDGEDAALTQTLRAMRTPTRLAAISGEAYPELTQPWQDEYARLFQAGLAGSRAAPASVVLLTDPDGVLRRWPPEGAANFPNFADALLGTATSARAGQPIEFLRSRYEGDAGPFTVVPIQLLLDPALKDVMAAQVQSRYVLIGSNLNGIDEFATPATALNGRLSKGVNVHAAMLAQRLDGADFKPISNAALWLLAIVVIALAAILGALELSGPLLILGIAAELAAVLGGPVALQATRWDTLQLPAFGWLVGAGLAYSVVAAAARSVGSQQRRLAQGALGRYLPPDIAAIIRRDPRRLELEGETREIFAVFSDLEGFTAMSHQLPPEVLADRLNRYLDTLSEVVLAHGGTLDKFVGDAVVAFWGAPIARPDDAARALSAAVAMNKAGGEVRDLWNEAQPGRTRVGLHFGHAVVGNFGGQSRLQYTALGDAMNTAARLEAANKALRTSVLVSAEAASRCGFEGLRPMGRVTLRGRETPVEVWEAGHAMSGEEAAELAGLWRAFDAGDGGALERLAVMGAKAPEDAVLAGLVERLGQAGPCASFKLG